MMKDIINDMIVLMIREFDVNFSNVELYLVGLLML